MCTEMALEICHLSKKLDFSRQRIQNTYVMQSFIISLQTQKFVYMYTHKVENRQFEEENVFFSLKLFIFNKGSFLNKTNSLSQNKLSFVSFCLKKKF